MSGTMQTVILRLGSSDLTDAQQKCLALTNKHLRHKELRASPKIDGPRSLGIDLLSFILVLISTLEDLKEYPVGDALRQAFQRCVTPEDFGGYGLAAPSPGNDDSASHLTHEQEREILFLCSAYLEALASEERARNKPKPLSTRPAGRRAMNMTEKIFAAHDISRRGEVKPGDIIQVDVDWVLASEISWQVSVTLCPAPRSFHSFCRTPGESKSNNRCFRECTQYTSLSASPEYFGTIVSG
jgi:hypothetical protein